MQLVVERDRPFDPQIQLLRCGRIRAFVKQHATELSAFTGAFLAYISPGSSKDSSGRLVVGRRLTTNSFSCYD